MRAILAILKVCVIGAVLVAGLSACDGDDVVLPGERLDIRAPADADGEVAATSAATENQGRPFNPPAPSANSEWTQRGAAAARTTHPALAAIRPVWTANIGRGNDRGHRIASDPVVADGRIFTLDSQSTVTAVSTAGAVLWTKDVTPPWERAQDASGGGLAVGGSRLFVTTGFGTLVALDAATGRELWVERLDSAATGAPAVRGDLVYAVSLDSRAWAIDVENGRIRWEFAATPAYRESSAAALRP